MQYGNQDKIHASSSAPQPAKAPSKVVNPAGNSTQQPAWTHALGDKPPAGLQTKLTVSQPGDAYEQEADRVAEQVMRMPAPGTAMPSIVPEQDESLMRKEGKASGAGGRAIEGAPPIVNSALSSGGQPLDAGTRTFMESRFGYNFSDVRVHTNGQAAESTQAVNARAYTVESDVVFGEGQYKPGTGEGQRLLAHELTHVVQQEPNTQLTHRDKGATSATQIEAHLPKGVIYRVVEGIAVADILDYERLAAQIHQAIAGLGSLQNEPAPIARLVQIQQAVDDYQEAVYRALQSLQREPAALERLQQTYRTKYGETLEDAIRGDFGGSALEYALQLLNMGTSSSAQAIGSAPVSAPDFQTAAWRIHQALEGLETDKEAIYAVLTPLQRDTYLIEQLSSTYNDLYNEDLRSRIVDGMSGSELDYALYLMGEQRMETTDISMDEARRLFDALSHATFEIPGTGIREPVPFHYPADGCYDRAYVMTNILTQMGYASEKVFAVSIVPGEDISGLSVPTPYAPDVKSPGQQPKVKWLYHVAPVIRVRGTPTPGQQEAPSVEMVLDPSLFDRPVTISEWTGRMSTGTFTRLRMDQLLAELHKSQRLEEEYPVNKRLVFTTERNVYNPPSLLFALPTPSEIERRSSILAEAQHAEALFLLALDYWNALETASGAEKEHKEFLKEGGVVYLIFARLEEVVANIRRALKVPPGTPVDVGAIVAAIRDAPANTPMDRLWEQFPNLHTEVYNAVPDPVARRRIEDEVADAIRREAPRLP
jgi:Domain of unknown function (DUF4157)/Glutaminase